MKKYIIYIGILLGGLLLGYLIFGGNNAERNTETATEEHDHDAENQLWTCSMHPQIMQPEPGDCPICGMELIPAENGGGEVGPQQIEMSETALALANIHTMKIGENLSGEQELVLSGKIVKNEEAKSVQSSYFDGRIEKLYINYTGEEVRRGQVLATIYSPELVSAQQELLTAARMKDSQSRLYESVRRKLKLWKLSDKQIQEIEASGEVKEYFPIYATVSGTVTEKLVEEGDYVKQGQPLYEIANLSTVWAQFDAYENQIAQLEEGQQINVTANALPGKEYEVPITFIEPLLSTATRTINVRVELSNKEGRLKPGMFVRGKVGSAEGDSGVNKENRMITVPKSAVMWTGERSLVYVQPNPDRPVFEMREVALGAAAGDSYAVTEGLHSGERIVVNGAFTVDAAAQLQGKKSMMNKDGNKTSTGHEGHSGMESGANSNNTAPVEVEEQFEVSQKLVGQFSRVFNEYIALKNALVKEDAETAQAASNKMLQALNKVDMGLLKDSKAHNRWMSTSEKIQNMAKKVAETIDIGNQREHFKALSVNFSTAVQLFGVRQTVYEQFCPMADDNKGGYWLSLNPEIENPYYGEAMLSCGETQRKL
ncbi:membrane fusion protein, Cu(I)/Ag(I) efflux system [Salegentibacter echinorum]|uniref:Membrane fusion protein, Cu(I)/Ag(I) efflux system n=1 Tax=Salegentibacter echinorum TaxID=1073325 RepID=A0A1M5INP0_SALEC|nr:efflux RND transporter periplasmic adaptor subunit [Salegentibacter echinorum]SHG29413.1 membrane fusion protein, Cu(I)/Ag(I) efflux system [Salegentibacter echinorum]